MTNVYLLTGPVPCSSGNTSPVSLIGVPQRKGNEGKAVEDAKATTAPTHPSPTPSEREFRRENIYRVGCCDVDRRAIEFGARFVVSMTMLGFCLWQATINPTNSQWWGGACMIVGYWFESPRLSSKK
jgi:hypothetical protein